MATSDSCKIEGWLVKKRGDYHKSKFFHYDSMRWFKLQEVNGTDHSELALCYYKSQKDKEPRGWIFMKDVSEIFDSYTSFTLVSPARTMTIETASPDEQVAWLRALVESCPHANTDKVFTPEVGQQAKQAGRANEKWSKDQDSEEYQPLDMNGLMQLNQSSKDSMAASEKSFDRSTSLFSRHADGDKNSFYFASSGQTQAMATISAEGLRSSDDEDYGRNHPTHIVGEGEVMTQLGGMQRNSAPNKGKLPVRSGVADRDDRDSSRGSREGERRALGANSHSRPVGGYGGGESASNRLHRHISRDSPARGSSTTDTVNPNVGIGAQHNRNASKGSVDADVESETEPRHILTGGAFDSTNSLQVDSSSSPHRLDRFAPPSPQNTKSPHGGIEVVDAGAEQERVLRSKAMLRNRQRRNQQRQGRRNAGSDDSESPDSASDSDSDDDYNRVNRTVNPSATARRRLGSRDDADDAPSGPGTPTHRLQKSLAPAPTTAPPPRRARDAIAAEEDDENNNGSSGRRVRESLDDVLRRRPNNTASAGARGETGAEAKAGRSVLGGGNGGDDDEDGEFDFKAEIRRYGGSREGDAFSAGGTATSAGAGADAKDSAGSQQGTSGPSRPPRPPPKGGANIYAASAAAVISSNKNSNTVNNNNNPGQNTINNIRRGTSTPPRQAGDPGSKMDRNFVDEDWDAEEESQSRGQSSSSAAAEAKDDLQKRGRVGGQPQHQSTVRADANWLEEDFDEA
mmetsp:Transcript_116398/g.228377  ORF Transcript_116398/g.228377 Transcript_116398/m.228377 type:complete len:741 (-) Transcript_116398:62-2284(-)